ncbi:MAG TPA: hypothetical protein V6D16_07600, partial [Candidatus Obscuribacterales bacterium]
MGNALQKYDFVACRLEYERLNELWARTHRSHSQQERLQDYRYPRYLPHAAGGTIGVKRSLYQTVCIFDESIPILDDTDFCWQLQLAGVELHFLPEAVVHYRFRDTLKGIYQQAQAYGESNVLLYKKYRPLGMPELSFLEGCKAWLRLLKRIPKTIRPEERAHWVRDFAWHLGRLKGSIKYHVWAL